MNHAIKHNKANLLLSAVIGLITAQASAGILYGTDYQSFSGRSGVLNTSDLDINRDGYFGAYCTNGADSVDRRMVYPFDIPNGFEIFGVRVWGEDLSATNDLQFALIEACQPFLAGGVPVRTTLASLASSGSSGRFANFLFTSQYEANANECAYFLEASFAADGVACDGANLSLTRIRILTNNPDVIFRSNFSTWGD